MKSKGQDNELNINPMIARNIIEILGSQGNPPAYGFQYFTIGLEKYLDVMEREYLSSYIKNGGSAFKMIVGIYGNGKTHFLYNVRELAWKNNYLSSYIVLSKDSSPFYKLEGVYKEIVNNLTYSQEPENLLRGYDKGIEAIIKKWHKNVYEEFSKKIKSNNLKEELKSYALQIRNYESISFSNAIRNSFISLNENNDEDFNILVQWLKGENPPKSQMKQFKIYERIDKSTAFKMIRSLIQWANDIGYAGIIILMDEAENIPSMSTKESYTLSNNLRELIDACSKENLRNTMWFYAVPDLNFLEKKGQIYEALRQRLQTIFDNVINPSGILIKLDEEHIELEGIIEFLKKIGMKLLKIYEIAYNIKFDENKVLKIMEEAAKDAYQKKYSSGYKREFVQSIVKAFHQLKSQI